MTYLQPWKLFSLACGIALLLIGSVYMNPGDWDFGVSIVMALGAYFFAPITVRTLLRLFKRPSVETLFYATIGLALAWVVVDGSYWAYHAMVGNPYWRVGNALASPLLYLVCGIIWARNESLAEMVRGVLR